MSFSGMVSDTRNVLLAIASFIYGNILIKLVGKYFPGFLFQTETFNGSATQVFFIIGLSLVSALLLRGTIWELAGKYRGKTGQIVSLAIICLLGLSIYYNF